jgi:hypothetical protein
MVAHGRRGGIASTILDFGTRWGWVVNVMPWPRLVPGKGMFKIPRVFQIPIGKILTPSSIPSIWPRYLCW